MLIKNNALSIFFRISALSGTLNIILAVCVIASLNQSDTAHCHLQEVWDSGLFTSKGALSECNYDCVWGKLMEDSYNCFYYCDSDFW